MELIQQKNIVNIAIKKIKLKQKGFFLYEFSKLKKFMPDIIFTEML